MLGLWARARLPPSVLISPDELRLGWAGVWTGRVPYLVPTSIQNLVCLTKSKNFKMNKESNEDGESKKPFLAPLAALLV